MTKPGAPPPAAGSASLRLAAWRPTLGPPGALARERPAPLAAGARIAARAPNHLGDGILALPALEALARLGELVIHAPPWGAELYGELPAVVRPRGRMAGDVAALFAPSLRAAWEARGIARVVGTPTDGRGLLLTDPIPVGGHRADEYARIAAAVGAVAHGPPAYGARGEPADVPEGHVALGPLTGRTRAWTGFPALARALDRPVVWYAGPGEADALARVAPDGLRCVGQPLPSLAATLARASVWVGNDSGLSHLARAVGVPSVVLFASTSPERTGPQGARALEGPPVPCRPCYRHTCAARLECLEIPVSRVLGAIGRTLGA